MKKVGFICLALILALGALGVGYATWSQELIITEEVNTGSFVIGVRDVETNDPGPALSEPGGEVYPASASEGTRDPGYEKNVGAAYSENGEYKCTHEGIDFYHDVTETIVNAYPSYSCTITLEFANCGSVPGIVESVTPEMISDPDGLYKFVEITAWEIFNDDGSTFDSGSGIDDLELALQGYQLDPCDVMRIDITKHILQDVGADECPQLATTSMKETVKWIQWNMAP